MAEAAAGARLDAAFNVRGDVELVGSPDGTYTITINPQRLVRRFYRWVFRFNRKVQNMIWPFTPTLWGLGVSGIVARVVTAPSGSWWRNGFLAEWLWKMDSAFPWQKRLPINLRVAWLSLLASAVGLLGISSLQRATMRLLLNYNGYMFLPRGSTPFYVKLWFGALKILGGSKPTLYNFQGCLPTLPVPPLQQTVNRFLLSVKPLVDDEKYSELQKKGEEFVKGHGRKAQLFLKLRSFWKRSWLWDWWETYVYLKGTDPIMINSNYYIMDGYKFTPSKHQAARAASLTFEADGFKELVDYEKLPPVRHGAVPWCMKQYERLFDTTRVPGKDGDKIEHFEVDLERYIAVSRRGVWYKLPLLVSDGGKMRSLQLPEIEKQLERIIKDADANPAPETENAIASLTGCKRNWWAEVREKEFDRGLNRDSLQLVERAAFHLHLDHRSPKDLDDQARMLIHGDGKSLWFDKSVTIIVFANGKGGMMCEHSYADALTNAHMFEWLMSGEVMNKAFSGPDEHTTGYDAVSVDKFTKPLRLTWKITPELGQNLKEAYQSCQDEINNLDLTLMQFEDWGKGFIKDAKCSPDAFMQLAMQLAYRIDSGGKCALTYEASVTRLFSHGRTETVRPLSIESKAFVDTMIDDKISVADRAKAFRAAAEKHSDLYKYAMIGQGIDRHLFGLYLVMRGFELAKEDDFISQAIRIPWTLSTSQSPQNQTTGRWDPNGANANMISPGGGFGPVDKDGYGVSYMFPNDHVIFAHVSSKKNSPNTDSSRFKANIAKSLNLIRKMLEEDMKARGIVPKAKKAK